MSPSPPSERHLFSLTDFDPKYTRPRGTWLDNRIAHLSASSIGMFRRCPEQWRQRYVLGKKEPPGEALTIGNFFHETMQFNYSQKTWSRTDRPLSEMLTFLQDEAVPRVLEAAGGVNEISWDLEDKWKALERARADSNRILSNYHAQVLPLVQPFETEQRLEWHITGVPVPVIGYLDVVAEGPEIVDTKTGKKVSNKVKPGWMTQGTLYASWSGIPVAYHSMSRAGKIVTPLQSPELLVLPNQKEAVNLAETIKTMIHMIETLYENPGPDRPWPTWGKFADWSMSTLPCGYCGYRKDCVAWA